MSSASDRKKIAAKRRAAIGGDDITTTTAGPFDEWKPAKATPDAEIGEDRLARSSGEYNPKVRQKAVQKKITESTESPEDKPSKRRKSATSFTEKAGKTQKIKPWEPTARKATKPKVRYETVDGSPKSARSPFGMKDGGEVEAYFKEQTIPWLDKQIMKGKK